MEGLNLVTFLVLMPVDLFFIIIPWETSLSKRNTYLDMGDPCTLERGHSIILQFLALALSLLTIAPLSYLNGGNHVMSHPNALPYHTSRKETKQDIKTQCEHAKALEFVIMISVPG